MSPNLCCRLEIVPRWEKRRSPGGGATPRFWTPTTPPTNCWPEAPWGGGALEGGSRRGKGGGGLREGRLGGGVQVGRFGVLGGGGGTGSPYLPLPSL